MLEDSKWKLANKELPEINREVIAITKSNKVVFAHRPQSSYKAKSIITGKIDTYYPKQYDGWNIPDIKWWLDLDLPI